MNAATVGYDKKLGVDITAPYIVWHGQHVEITANEAMQGAEGKTRQREAKDFLLDRLRSGPVRSDDLLDEAKQEGIAERTLKRVKKDLGVTSRREGGSTGAWFWELPAAKKATHLP